MFGNMHDYRYARRNVGLLTVLDDLICERLVAVLWSFTDMLEASMIGFAAEHGILEMLTLFENQFFSNYTKTNAIQISM